MAVCGDGMQVRGNTYIDGCVEATVAATGAMPAEVYNVGGETATVRDIIRKLEAITGRRAAIHREPARPGDQRSTCDDTGKLARHLGWRPQVSLDEGLACQVAWQEAPGAVAGLRKGHGQGERHVARSPMNPGAQGGLLRAEGPS
jgi:nucleoside-diphosphate-sugar epimerase